MVLNTGPLGWESSTLTTRPFGRCSSELAKLVPRPFSRGRSTRYSDVNSFFPRTAKLWNSLPMECLPLTYDLSGFKSRINRHLLTVGSF